MFKKPKYFNTKEEIEDKLTDIDIYQYYIGANIKQIPFKCKSPLRDEEHPSFGLFSLNGKILWKDFALNESGDVYKFVMKLFNIPFSKALLKIKKDIIDRDIMYMKKEIYNIKNERQVKIIDSNINIQPYYFKNPPKSFYEYFKQYKVITKDVLKNNSVSAAKFVFLNNKIYARYKDNDIIIVYKWKRKGNNRIYHKIYRPMNKERKWLSDFRGSSKWLIHGLNKIDESLDYIIITKSVKDKMVLEGLGYNSINVQNEGISIPQNVINYLKDKYKYIYLLYDNDYNKSRNYGQIAARNVIKQYPCIINIKIDGRYKCTDISEYISKYSIIKTNEYIQRLVNERRIQ